MYYLRDGLGAKKHCRHIGKILAVLFSVFAVVASFGIGNMGQVTSICESVQSVVSFTGSAVWDSVIIGTVVMVVAALVTLGGIQRIARANEKLVPFMAVFYIIGAVAIVVMHFDQVGAAFASIFRNAFSFEAVSGGVGGALHQAGDYMGLQARRILQRGGPWLIGYGAFRVERQGAGDAGPVGHL